MYSAIKRDGEPPVRRWRAPGVEVERAARPVTIYRLDLTAWDPPFCDLEVAVLTGYVYPQPGV